MPREIQVRLKNADGEIQIGDYRFNGSQFLDLAEYVWRGGYPRWKDNIRPSYVLEMRDSILHNCHGIFEGIPGRDLAGN